MDGGGWVLPGIKASERHATPELIVFARQDVEMGSAGDLRERAIFLADDLQEPCT